MQADRAEMKEQILIMDQERNKKRAALLEMQKQTSPPAEVDVDCGGFFMSVPRKSVMASLSADIEGMTKQINALRHKLGLIR